MYTDLDCRDTINKIKLINCHSWSEAYRGGGILAVALGVVCSVCVCVLPQCMTYSAVCDGVSVLVCQCRCAVCVL